MNEPITCDCDDPHADAIGQCADCKRLVLQAPKVQVAFPSLSAPTVAYLGIGDVVVVTHEGGPSMTFPTPAALRAWMDTVAAELDIATGPRVDVAALLADEARTATDEALRLAMHPPHPSTVDWTPEVAAASYDTTFPYCRTHHMNEPCTGEAPHEWEWDGAPEVAVVSDRWAR